MITYGRPENQTGSKAHKLTRYFDPEAGKDPRHSRSEETSFGTPRSAMKMGRMRRQERLVV
jgi:hypothetical protein